VTNRAHEEGRLPVSVKYLKVMQLRRMGKGRGVRRGQIYIFDLWGDWKLGETWGENGIKGILAQRSKIKTFCLAGGKGKRMERKSGRNVTYHTLRAGGGGINA